MEGKKIVVIAVLIAVIVAAAVITAKRSGGGNQPPAWVLDQKIDKIDIKTFDVSTQRLGDWMDKYAADKTGYYKNPKTGEYSMTDIMKCSACGATIPVPQMPAELRDKVGDPGAMNKWQEECKCPKCGKCPFGPPHP